MWVMHQYLHLFLFEMQILQVQTDANKAEGCAFEQTFKQRIEDHPDRLYFIFFQ